MTGKLHNRVAIVTGSTNGMGASVIVHGRNAQRGEQVVADIHASGGKAKYIAADIATEPGNQCLVEAALEHFGQLNIVVVNAGMLGNGRITEFDAATWHTTISTNLHAAFYLLKAALPHMQSAGGSVMTVDGGRLLK